jgi:hypothetical protein
MTYRIERGIGIPPKTGSFVIKYPWRGMKVGDSFTVPVKDLPASGAGAIRSSARSHGFRAATRTQGNQVRAWRIK